MSIHQTIYDTLSLPAEVVAELIGVGDVQSVYDRRDQMASFLEVHEWNEEKYKMWLRGNPPLPKIQNMAVNVASALRDAVGSRFKKVDAEEQKRRHDICIACSHHRAEDDRCSVCGCFTNFKASLEAWHCPIEMW